MPKETNLRAELAQVIEHLRDPMRMRLTVAGVTLVVMFFAISEPLHGRIKRSKRDLNDLKNTAATAQEVVLLRNSFESIDDRVMRGGNDEVTSRLINMVRQESLDLLRIDAEAPTRLGPLETIRASIDVAGSFESLNRLLYRIESDQFLMRIETLTINPPERRRTTPSMQISVRILKDKS